MSTKALISIVSLALLVLTGSGSAWAQQAALTLDDCITLALANRAAIIRARGAEQVAAAGKLNALGAFLPSVSASYNYSKGKETNIEPADTIGGEVIDEQDIGPSKRWSISGDMALFDVSSWFNYAAARADHQRSKLDVMASEQDMILAVKIAYYAYLASEENLDVQKEAVKRAEEQLKLIQSRFDLGSASLSDVLKQKVQYGNDRLGLLRAENGVTNARADLSYTIGLDPLKDHAFSSDYSVREYSGSLDEAIAFGLENNPTLRSTEKSLAAASADVKSAWAAYLPTVGLFADYQKFNGTQAFPVAFDYSSNSLTYGFGVRLNIFDGFLRERTLTTAKVSRNNARADLADTRNATVTNIKTAYLDIEQLKQQQSVSQENVAAAEEDLKITQEKYNLGAATILDLLDAQVSLKTAQVGLIQAEFDLNLAVSRLEAALGKR
ncbi:MAG: TolC family protein [candidate division Zixibacteria bacterium]|jgi:outer membrane protein TolC|nr:TolC family protein [candidate division Zixibacteria bacterium]